MDLAERMLRRLLVRRPRLEKLLFFGGEYRGVESSLTAHNVDSIQPRDGVVRDSRSAAGLLLLPVRSAAAALGPDLVLLGRDVLSRDPTLSDRRSAVSSSNTDAAVTTAGGVVSHVRVWCDARALATGDAAAKAGRGGVTGAAVATCGGCALVTGAACASTSASAAELWPARGRLNELRAPLPMRGDGSTISCTDPRLPGPFPCDGTIRRRAALGRTGDTSMAPTSATLPATLDRGDPPCVGDDTKDCRSDTRSTLLRSTLATVVVLLGWPPPPPAMPRLTGTSSSSPHSWARPTCDATPPRRRVAAIIAGDGFTSHTVPDPHRADWVQPIAAESR